ncbi:MAG: VanW family protein, partial [Clostridia bacterium]
SPYYIYIWKGKTMKKATIYDVTLYCIISLVLCACIFLVTRSIISSNKKLRSNAPIENIPMQEEKEKQVEEKKETEKVEKEHVPEPQPVETELSTYTSEILDKKGDRVHNIALASKNINGVQLEDGQVFSFNESVKPINEENGYRKASTFKGKKEIMGVGGGVCQVSSTLYNAVLDAGLEVVERHAHSMRVYYVPKDRDATIFQYTTDFKFKNTSGAKITIGAEASETAVKISLTKIEVK